MELAITSFSAWVYLPFVLPICFYSAFTDLREMRITNQAVLALGGLFLVLGLIALPFSIYLLHHIGHTLRRLISDFSALSTIKMSDFPAMLPLKAIQ